MVAYVAACSRESRLMGNAYASAAELRNFVRGESSRRQSSSSRDTGQWGVERLTYPFAAA